MVLFVGSRSESESEPESELESESEMRMPLLRVFPKSYQRKICLLTMAGLTKKIF